MFALKRDRGSTLVLVTHDMALAARCDRTIHLRSGQIEANTLSDPAPGTALAAPPAPL